MPWKNIKSPVSKVLNVAVAQSLKDYCYHSCIVAAGGKINLQHYVIQG